MAQSRVQVAGFCEHSNELSGYIRKQNIFWRAEW